MYLHVDINAYFATLLQQETPSLRGVPLLIVKDVGRTCVIAASKEAKVYGIKVGYSIHDALRLVPGARILPADFGLYHAATIRLKHVFSAITPDPEIFSLDETFIPFDPIARLHDHNPMKLGRKIQAAIKTELGEWVTCNVGIGPTRFLAKMAGETSPKGSVTEVTEETKDALLASTTFADVCGIGPRLARRLALLGITVPYQINFIPDDVLERRFGPFWSIELKRMAQGEEPHFLRRLSEPLDHMKGIGRSITLYDLTSDEHHIKQVLYNLSEEVIYKARKQQLSGRQVSLTLIGQNTGWGRHVTLRSHIRHTQEFFQVVHERLYPLWPQHFSVIRFAVRLGLLEPWSQVQEPLLPEWWHTEQISQALDRINDRYGLFTVHSGLLSNFDIIRPEVTGFLGDKQFQLSET